MIYDKFLILYKNLISESIHNGDYINEMPLSLSKGLKSFKINTGHSSQRDDERLLSYEIDISNLISKFDELCSIILTSYQSQLNNNLRCRFAGIFKHESDFYKIIIGFSNLTSAYFVTGYSISEKQFNKFSSYNGKMYVPLNGNPNFIILLKNC